MTNDGTREMAEKMVGIVDVVDRGKSSGERIVIELKMLEVEIANGPHKGIYLVDVIEATLLCGEIEDQIGVSKLDVVPQEKHLQLLRSLSQAIVRDGLMPYCTPTIAMHIHGKIAELNSVVKKNVDTSQTLPGATESIHSSSEQMNSSDSGSISTE